MIKDALKYLEPNACVPIDMETTIMLVNALKEALAQRTEQEPVAWLCTPNEDGLFGLPLSDKGCKDCFPVYRHPPAQPAQQKKVWTFWDLSGGDITDAIKAKLKEKNNG